jgi:hypothetical protein
MKNKKDFKKTRYGEKEKKDKNWMDEKNVILVRNENIS